MGHNLHAHPVGLTCGALEQLFGTGGRKFGRQKSKNSNPRGDVKRLQIDRCIQVWPLKWKLSMSTFWWWCSRCCWTKFMFLQILYLIWTEKHGRERVKGMPAASEAVINPHAKHPWWGKIYFAVCWWSFLNPWGKDGLWLHQNLEPHFSVHWRVRLKNLFSDSLSEPVLFRSSLMRVDDDSAR